MVYSILKFIMCTVCGILLQSSPAGPRFVLQLIKIFEGSFGGPTLYENPHYVTPNIVSYPTTLSARSSSTSVQCGVLVLLLLLTLGAHARSEGYCSCPVCVCVSVRSFLPPRASTPRNIGTYVFTVTRKKLL